MRDYLIFRLYGPLAAWGDIAVGEIRPSAAYPPKSAVLGLVAAAMGIRREEESAHRALFRGYGFGVKIISMGTLLQDYHTTQAPPARRNVVYATRKEELAAPKLGTILSTREYRCDALCVAALWSRTEPPPHSLTDMANALNRPKFVLYLGRKSCPPALPLQARVTAAETLKDALDAEFSVIENAWRLPRHASIYCWDEADHAGMAPSLRVRRHDEVVSRKRRQFEPRVENQWIVEEDADAF
jgi:CRISPR system Cascade subunit CasD